MTEISVQQAKDVWNRRLPLYAYLEPLLAGRRVLELGCGTGAGAAHIASHGAAEVTAIDTDAGAIDRARARHGRANLDLKVVANLLDGGGGQPFDIVLVPEADELLRRPEAIPALGQMLAEGGRLVLVVTSAERVGAGTPAGIGYYELSDALLPHFSSVQMFGVTPFAGFGIVEFDGDDEGLRVDSRLIEDTGETPASYVAVAGSEPAAGLGYALVQVAAAPIEARLAATAAVEDRGTEARLATTERRLNDVERRARARVEEAEARVGELRRKLEDSEAEAQAALRVARAQSGEIEELRGRLRRAAEDRALLDGELAKLRRALAEADESVMNLTRRTAEEMSAVAARLAAGLRGPAPDARPSPEPRAPGSSEEAGRLRAALEEAEGRAGAAEQRLEEVGAVGRERQAALDDVLERLRQSEEATARERREVARLQERVREAGGIIRTADERETTLARRDERIALLEGEKQELVWRMAEMEEKLRHTIGRAVVADSTGRSKDDELDAARASRARALEEFHKAAGAHVDEVTQLRASVSEQAALVAELEDSLRTAEAAAAAATAEAAALRKNAKGLEEADRTRRTRLAELEGKLLRLEHERKQGAGVPAGGEEALAKARDEVLAGQARIATLEAEVARLQGELGARPAAGHNGRDTSAARELEAVEAGLRQELASLAEIEQALEGQLGARGEAGATDAEPGAEVLLLQATLANYRRRASELRDELTGIRRRLDSLSPDEISGYLEELGEDLAEMELPK